MSTHTIDGIVFEEAPDIDEGSCTGCCFSSVDYVCQHPSGINAYNIGCSRGGFIFKPHDDAARAWFVATRLST